MSMSSCLARNAASSVGGNSQPCSTALLSELALPVMSLTSPVMSEAGFEDSLSCDRDASERGLSLELSRDREASDLGLSLLAEAAGDGGCLPGGKDDE